MDKAIDGYTRQDLWDRLEQLDYFDWCRKEECKQLKALYFDGTVVEAPKEFITCRELMWSPLQGEAHWRSVMEARCGYKDEDSGEWAVSPYFVDEFVKERLHALFLEDYQPYGMTVEDQVALIRFLGFEHRSPYQAHSCLTGWIAQIWYWLDGKASGQYGLAGLTDTPSSRMKDLFYQVLVDAPLAVKGKRLLVREERTGWNDDRAKDLHSTLKQLFAKLDKYSLPKKLVCDPAPRLQLVESLRADLESGAAPQILRDVWNIWQSRTTRTKAKAA